MNVRELAAKTPVSIAADATLAAAAALMNRANVGALLVMDGERLAGIVSDRDIAVRGVARHLASDARIDSVMTTDVVSIDAEADLEEAYRLFETHALRRLPVREGDRVIGMLAIDDALVVLAQDLQRLVRPIVGELAFGHHPTAVPATT